jgi:REP element-mobilizing transposase RayT
MSHTHANVFIHYVFSTKKRQRWLTPEVTERLWPYMGGIARENGIRPISIGGTEDHLHFLADLGTKITVSKGIQLIKAGSSGWLSKTYPDMGLFSWQEGYGAFSIGASQKGATIRYIEKQQEHHKIRSFQEEYMAILKVYGIEYDPRHIWD